jgi:hypothetical protein
MSKSHRRDPGPQVSPRVRELLRANRAAVDLELALTDRGGDVRMTLPKIAWETYEEVPDSVEARYLPGAGVLMIDLPEPDAQVQLADFEGIDDEQTPAEPADRDTQP